MEVVGDFGGDENRGHHLTAENDRQWKTSAAPEPSEGTPFREEVAG